MLLCVCGAGCYARWATFLVGSSSSRSSPPSPSSNVTFLFGMSAGGRTLFILFFLTLQHQWDVTLNTRCCCCCCWSGTPANAHAKHTSQSRRSPAATRNEQITDCGLNSCQGRCSADCCRLNDDKLSIYVCFSLPFGVKTLRDRGQEAAGSRFPPLLVFFFAASSLRELVGTRVHYRHRLASVILQRK